MGHAHSRQSLLLGPSQRTRTVISQAKLKTEIKLADAHLTPKTLVAKDNALAFAIETPDQKHRLFWSPFQKEVLEWINELRKLKYILSLGGVDVGQYCIAPIHSHDETNLTVRKPRKRRNRRTTSSRRKWPRI